MCHPTFLKEINRRRFIQTSVVGVASLVSSGGYSSPAEISTTFRFNRIIDLTHTLSPEFPTFSGQPHIEIHSHENDPFGEKTMKEMGINFNTWTIHEHTGTHLDAPIHFFIPESDPSGQKTMDQLTVTDLIGPLAVIDIREKAENNPDSFLTLEDIQAWEAKHGPIPERAIVAMWSGWDRYVASERFRNVDDQGVMHSPGFHIEAVEYLIEKRDTKGIVVDTISLDAGFNSDFSVHYRWLPSNRWGIECAANLGEAPPIGATIFVGVPKVKGATGGPCRMVAFV